MNSNITNTLLVGSNGRIGKAICEHLINNNHNVFGLDIKNTKKKHENYIFNNVNITKSAQIDKFFDTNKKINFLNLIYCAYPFNKSWGTKFEKLNFKNLSENITSQLTSQIYFLKNFFNHSIKNKARVKVILFSSIQGLGSPKFEHYKSLNMGTPIEYSATKASVINITKYLAKYYKGYGYNINCISPGGIKDNQNKIFIKRYKKSSLNNGLLDPKDILSTVDFLISNKSKFINGQNIIVDDGWSI